MLLRNIEEVKAVFRVSPAASYDLLATHLGNAENAFIVPLLGRKMYQELVNYHADPANFRYDDPNLNLTFEQEGSGIGSGSGSGDEETDREKAWALVLWFVQHAIVHLAYFSGFDALNAYISDSGFKRVEGEQTKSLFKYQEDRLKQYFLDGGMTSLDTVLEILEDNMAYFEAFDPVLRQLQSKIFPDTKTFQSHYFIDNSRLTFLRLAQHIKTVEELDITQAVGAENIALIQAELQKEVPDTKVVTLLPYLRDPIAYLSTAMLMEESGADLTERGLWFKAQKSVTNADFIMHADPARIAELVRRNRELGAMYLNRLISFMNASGDWGDNLVSRGRFINRDNTDKRIFVA